MDLSTLITNINGKDFAKAQVIFDDMMNAKVTDALDKEKVKLAGQVFNGDPEEDEDLVDEVEVEGDEDTDADNTIRVRDSSFLTVDIAEEDRVDHGV